MHTKILLLFIFCWGSWLSAVAQPGGKKLKDSAEKYYTHGKYPEALNLLLKYQRIHKPNAKVKLWIGHCYLETNRPGEARRYLEAIAEGEKNPPAETWYHLARCHHAEHQFEEATVWYKKFLAATIRKGHPYREAVKDALLRCVNGFRQSGATRQVIVENLGEEVNTRGDDFAPVLSPNHGGKLYFSSARKGNIGGLRKADGTKDDTYGRYKADMFACQVVNGQWSETQLLHPFLNSAKNDVILGFNTNGSVMYYFKGIGLKNGEIYTDTFGTDKAVLVPAHFPSPVIPENGDGDLFFFNDTTLLFSSSRPGGYGGKDLYIAYFSGDRWSRPSNLGPVINSPYDETTPFLAADGRTLYFSSNNLKSMGDLDIFKSKFNDGKGDWSEPQNLGLPFNSAREDAHFKLSKDGMKAYFSSSRLESIGERDLFVGYFSTSQGEQRPSHPPLFADVLARKSQGMDGVEQSAPPPIWQEPNQPSGQAGNTPTDERQTERYRFDHLAFDANGTVLTKDNQQTLQQVARLMKEYPSIQLELVSHTDPSGQAKFDLYFSAKRAEEVVNFLIGKGVPATSLFIRGCGANYPIAKNETESGQNELGRKLNRRIELAFHRTQGLPIAIDTQPPKVPAFLQTDSWDNYQQTIKGVSYKIQIATMKQMYNGELLTRLPNAGIESGGALKTYQYTIGLFQNHSSAHQLHLELVRQGITDVVVIPYINGLRVSTDNAKLFATAYPDLYNYLRFAEE